MNVKEINVLHMKSHLSRISPLAKLVTLCKESGSYELQSNLPSIECNACKQIIFLFNVATVTELLETQIIIL